MKKLWISAKYYVLLAIAILVPVVLILFNNERAAKIQQRINEKLSKHKEDKEKIKKAKQEYKNKVDELTKIREEGQKKIDNHDEKIGRLGERLKDLEDDRKEKEDRLQHLKKQRKELKKVEYSDEFNEDENKKAYQYILDIARNDSDTRDSDS